MSGGELAGHGLLLDYGGVLTSPVGASFRAWERRQGLEAGALLRLVVSAYDDHDGGMIGALERGELSPSEFDAQASQLLAEHGHVVEPGSVLTGLFAAMRPDPGMWEVAADARAAGVRTGLLSNSWGLDAYPTERLAAHFDTVVISAEVGLRKPDPAIYELARRRLDLPATSCAFVDDLDRNVEVARDLGMFGVVHAGDVTATRARLEDFFGRPLARDPVPGPDRSERDPPGPR